MKRFTLIGIVLFLFIITGYSAAAQSIKITDTPSEARLLSQDEAGLVLKSEIGEITFFDVNTPEGVFAQIGIEGLVPSGRIGEPNLPTLNRLISIPYGCELSVEILESDVEEVSLSDYRIMNAVMPVQPSLSKSQIPEDVPFEFNRNLYRQGAFYSMPLAEVSQVGVMRAMRLGLLSISPLEYDPVNNMLRIHKSITVRVNFLNPDWNGTRKEWQRLYSPFYTAVYGRVFNYQEQEPILLDDMTRYPIKYVIVSHRMFETQIQPFIEWKIKKGFEVIIGYTDVIGNTNTAIKSWIRDIYNNSSPAPSFVLFVGDAQQIPPFQYSGHISDLGFCEYTSDNIPEIYYGRFSAQNTNQLQPQIDKTLEYEQYTMPDPNFLGEVTMIAGADANYAPIWGNGQINYGTDEYFNTAHGIYSNTWLYPESEENVEAAIIQTINEGLCFINYTAHGSHESWADPLLTTGNVNNLTNAHKYPLAVGNCCLTNTFGADYGTPCLGEVWLQAANKGAIGYIGASNSSYWDEDYWWGVGNGPIEVNPSYEDNGIGAYDGMFHDHGEPVSLHYVTNDAINFCGNMAVQESNSSLKAYYWQIYHLMGDPSVMTYLGVPESNVVIHDPAMIFNLTNITVYAVPGSYVGISQTGILHGSAYIDSSGFADIELSPFDGPGAADIVVTAQNRIPYVSTIQLIAPEGPYVVYDSLSINDTAGNGDGQVDAGEHIQLGVQLINVGPDSAYDVVAMISSNDNHVLFTDAQEAYGSIEGDNGVSYRADAFAFDLDGGTPDGANITFSLLITCAGPETTSSNFIIPIYAPDMEYVATLVDDIGNDNGVLDPGESANLTVTIANEGSKPAISVQGVLSESDPYLSISDADGTFGNIIPGGYNDNAADQFTIEASAFCPQGYSANLTLTVSATGGYHQSISFPIIVGDRAVIFYDDLSSNLGWTGLGGQAEWTIGEATGGAGNDTHGGPDPSQDNSPTSDDGVLGNDLTPGTGGDYAALISQTRWITSPTIDCSNFTSVIMTYYHWLGLEQDAYDHAYLDVYNGANWIRLFDNGSDDIDESSWNLEQYDLTDIADGNANFKIRFGLGTTDGSYQFCGWNIDDILLRGYVLAPPGNPDLAFSISNIADSLIQGDTATHRFKIYNQGDGALNVTFTCDEEWLGFQPGQQIIPPFDSLDYDVAIYSAGLAPGLHSCTLSYSSNDPEHAGGSLPVELFVYPPGTCYYMPGDINGNDQANGIDVTYGVGFFKGGMAPADTCRDCPAVGQDLMAAGDVNGNCSFNGVDLTYYVAFLKGYQEALGWCQSCPPAPLASPGPVNVKLLAPETDISEQTSQ